MFTVEFESDASVITTLDQEDRFEDVEMALVDDGTIYLRQFDERLNEHQMVFMSYQEWVDLMTAYHSPEGVFRLNFSRGE